MSEHCGGVRPCVAGLAWPSAQHYSISPCLLPPKLSVSHTKGRPGMETAGRNMAKERLARVCPKSKGHVPPPVCLYSVSLHVLDCHVAPEKQHPDFQYAKAEIGSNTIAHRSLFCQKETSAYVYRSQTYTYKGIHAQTHLPTHPHRL